jgi:hypothetical protein
MLLKAKFIHKFGFRLYLQDNIPGINKDTKDILKNQMI